VKAFDYRLSHNFLKAFKKLIPMERKHKCEAIMLLGGWIGACFCSIEGGTGRELGEDKKEGKVSIFFYLLKSPPHNETDFLSKLKIHFLV
jgi:hypothetical protein